MKILTYSLYIDLLNALDEYTNCTLRKSDIQDLIFDRYAKDGPFVAENSNGDRAHFHANYVWKSRVNQERKRFRFFMNGKKYHTPDEWKDINEKKENFSSIVR